MFTPRTALEASRLIRATEASFALDVTMFWNGDNTCTMDSWKTGEDVKRTKSRYEVDVNKGTCTCADFAENRLFCKHLIKAERTAADVEAEEAQEILPAQRDFDAEIAELYPH